MDNNNQQQFNEQQPQFNEQPPQFNEQPPQFNTQPDAQMPQGEKKPDGKGMSVAALVLGICSAAFSLFWAAVFPVNLLFLACGIVGIVLAALGRKKSKECYGKASGIETAGLVLSIIGTSLSALFIVSCLACVSCISAELGAFEGSYTL